MLLIRPYEKNDLAAIMAYDLPKEQAMYTSMPVDLIEAAHNNPDHHPYVIVNQGERIRLMPVIKKRDMLCKFY